jgi:hypothetical protein
MFLPIFEGGRFSYSYEEKTESYLIVDKKCKFRVTIKNEKADIFRKTIEAIPGNLNENIGTIIERAIHIYLWPLVISESKN